MTTRRRVALLALAAVIVGALTPSYLHLVDWWRPMMPTGWQSLATVAALVTEATIIACGWIGATMGRDMAEDGRRVIGRLEAAGVIAAVYVNARWAALRPDAPPLTLDTGGTFAALDMVAGAAMLPVVAWAAFRAASHVMQAGVVATAPSTVPASTATVETPPQSPTPTPTPTPRRRPAVAGGILAHDASVAAAWGVSPRTARDWRARGDPRYGQRPEARAA